MSANRISGFRARAGIAGLAAVTLAGAFIAAPATAQDKGTEGKHLESLRQCRSLTDAAARLACFDTATGTILAASERGELRVVDKEQMTRTRRRLFGFTLPDIGLFGGDDDKEPPMDMLETTITTVQSLGRSDWAFSTPEGGVWQISNAPFRFDPPKTGDKVVFKRAALGSYFIRINGQTGVKGRRIR